MESGFKIGNITFGSIKAKAVGCTNLSPKAILSVDSLNQINKFTERSTPNAEKKIF